MKTHKYIQIFLALILVNLFPLNVHSQTEDINQNTGTIHVLPSQYTNNMVKIWNINIGDNKSVKINYNIDIESNYDYIYIFSIDMFGNEYFLTKLTGRALGSATTTFTTGKARIKFITNERNAGELYSLGVNMSFSSESSLIGIQGRDQFQYDGEFLQYYGVGFHSYKDNTADSDWLNLYGSAFYGIDLFTGGQNRFRINTNGNIGIGTVNPMYKLDVKGTIRATEIKVESISQFPDYVFAPEYKLPTLQSVEQHIQDKGHLPEIPSASEVQEKGINLAEMQVKLLKKIEEMTLYILQQQKQITEQQEMINLLKEDLESLKK